MHYTFQLTCKEKAKIALEMNAFRNILQEFCVDFK